MCLFDGITYEFAVHMWQPTAGYYVGIFSRFQLVSTFAWYYILIVIAQYGAFQVAAHRWFRHFLNDEMPNYPMQYLYRRVLSKL